MDFDAKIPCSQTTHFTKNFSITKKKSFSFDFQDIQEHEYERAAIPFEKQRISNISPTLNGNSLCLPVKITSKVSPSITPNKVFHSISELIKKDESEHFPEEQTKQLILCNNMEQNNNLKSNISPFSLDNRLVSLNRSATDVRGEKKNLDFKISCSKSISIPRIRFCDSQTKLGADLYDAKPPHTPSSPSKKSILKKKPEEIDR